MKRFLMVVLCLGAGFAQAQDEEVAAFGPLLEQCYEAASGAEAKAQCLGAVSKPCMAQPGGETTLGITMCASAEAQVWDKFLNAEYKALMAFSKAMDVDEAAYFPEYAKREENLRAAQRAWIAYRDAECGLAYALWGSGSMRNIAGSDCIMQMTAERTIELIDMREQFQ